MQHPLHRWFVMALLVIVGAFQADAAPERGTHIIRTAGEFDPVLPGDTNRPAWLWSTARGTADSGPGTRPWVIYEVALDRQTVFHSLLVELALSAQPDLLFVRLLDRDRTVLVDDLYGNLADRIVGNGNTLVDVPLATHPNAAVVQFLIPEDQESALRVLAVSPASYEILMRTSRDFASGAKAWIRTPVFDARNETMLQGIVIRPDGQQGDLTSPLSSFQAYGVNARDLDVTDAAVTGAPADSILTTTFALDALPALARFDVLLRNFDPLEPIDAWLNGQRIGTLSIALPDLADAAYSPPDPSAGWRVGRWTRAWLFIPTEAFRLGDHDLRLTLRSAEPPEPMPEAARPSLQFKYPWEEIATYSLVTMKGSTRDERPAGDISHAPPETVRQDDDVFIVRMDEPFHAIGINSAKPAWLHSVERDTQPTEDYVRSYTIRLDPDPARRPEQLGIDVIYERGRHAPLRLALLRGPDVLVTNLLGEQRLDSPYVQMGIQLHVPLHDHAEADAVRVEVGSPDRGVPRLLRMQLKAAWPGAVLAASHPESDGSLADVTYDSRSDFIPAEVIAPGPTSGAASIVTPVPTTAPHGASDTEVRLVHGEPIAHGDVRDRYFSEWALHIDRQPQLGRVELLVTHLNVIDGMEVFINGKPAGFVSLHLPGVQDANYMIFQVRKITPDGGSLTQDERYAIDYGPFARATLVFDGNLLRPGPNTIRIGRTPRLRGTNDHYAFKAVRLQLKY